ncbi:MULTISPECIES: DsbC family protein [Sphingomonas]|jgi:thiol:disulfide interchange protein DsbC|uniref:Thiol:disulfide interchange protein n=2 Tax=Sphingomonas ginsenosidimutans TaxID=862134 RepID=A0A2A4HT49_9SPHN|nr:MULTISPECIES: DsbC family protein [Sphingomonas]PCG07550.1 disulfide bond formation protein DsbC [Sphingomonas ginsenosidimutans]
MISADTRLGHELARMRRMEGIPFWSLLASASLVVGMGAGVVAKSVHAAAPAIASVDTGLVREALKLRLPKTRIGAIDCSRFGGLCEVVAGTTLFYVDRSARFLMIGRLYDMETRSDVTATRLLELNPDMLAAGAAGRRDDDDAQPAAATPAAAKVDLAQLPAGGAVHWGPANGPKLVVLSDFHCGYCRKLSAELARMGARVEERPISIFGAESRKLSEAVLCAADPAAAAHAAYADQAIAAGRKCDVSGLDANEAFARKHGFGGTPVIIRADGAVLQGFHTAEQLKAFVAGGRA